MSNHNEEVSDGLTVDQRRERLLVNQVAAHNAGAGVGQQHGERSSAEPVDREGPFDEFAQQLEEFGMTMRSANSIARRFRELEDRIEAVSGG